MTTEESTPKTPYQFPSKEEYLEKMRTLSPQEYNKWEEEHFLAGMRSSGLTVVKGLPPHVRTDRWTATFIPPKRTETEESI